MKEIILSPAETDVLFRQDPDTEADGGFQKFLVSLQRKVNKTSGALVLTAEDLEKIPRYAFDYGNGGWENRLKGIFSRVLGPLLGR
jgi:hypothetical protein